MLSLESTKWILCFFKKQTKQNNFKKNDKMAALWSNNSLTFIFDVRFSNNLPNYRTFAEEDFWFHA